MRVEVVTGLADSNWASDPENREIKKLAGELMVLCRAFSLRGDLPGHSKYDAIFDEIGAAIDEMLDRDMAVDPIEHALGALVASKDLLGLEELAFACLRRRDDRGNWAALNA